MTISLAAHRLVLTQTLDPLSAADAASALNSAAITHQPRVPFPAKWVLAAQLRPAPFAAYAAHNCADSDTLQEIWQSTSRATVRLAIAGSPYLSNITRLTLLASPLTSAATRTALYDPLRSRNPQAVIDHVLTSNLTPKAMSFLVERDDLSPEQVDSLVLSATAAGKYEPFNEVLMHRLGRTRPHLGLSVSSFSIHDLATSVAALAPARPDLQISCQSAVELAYSKPNSPRALNAQDLTDIKRLTGCQVPPRRSSTSFRAPLPLYASDAIDELLVSPGVDALSLLSEVVMSDDQFERFVNFLDPSSYLHERMACNQATSPARLYRALEYFGPTSKDRPTTLDLLERANSLDPDLVHATLLFTNNYQDYFAGQLQIETLGTIVPTLDETAKLLRDGAEFDLGSLVSRMMNPYRPLAVEITKYLLNNVLGLVKYIMDDPYPTTSASSMRPLARVVYEELDAVGPAMLPIALELLSRNDLTLAQVLATTRMIAQS